MLTIFGFPEKSVNLKDLRSYVRPPVRDAVSRKPFITIFETLQFVRACKRNKNLPSSFLKKISFCPFWPKTVQNWRLEVFRIFSQSVH